MAVSPEVKGLVTSICVLTGSDRGGRVSGSVADARDLNTPRPWRTEGIVDSACETAKHISVSVFLIAHIVHKGCKRHILKRSARRLKPNTKINHVSARF